MADYYMPQTAHAFLDWARNFYTVAGNNAMPWGLDPVDIQELQNKTGDFSRKLEMATRDSASRESIRVKNTALKAVRALFRNYVNEHIRYSKKIDDNGRRALAVHMDDDIRINNPVPQSRVIFIIHPANNRELRNDFHDETTGKKTIDRRMSGAVQARRILIEGEPVPADPERFPFTDLLASSPHIDEYRAEDRGKRVAYAMCWRNTKGKKGPWSDVQVHIIP